MKRYYRHIAYLSVSLTLLISLDGCTKALTEMKGDFASMTAIRNDPSLPVVSGIKTVIDKTSVGFEWKPIKDKRVDGIAVYRAEVINTRATPYKKITTIGNRYATHFVDTKIQAGRYYLYRFQTVSMFAGSRPSRVIRVKTAPPLPPVPFADAYEVDKGVVKVLWTPHPDPRITKYVVQRRLRGMKWSNIATLEGRLTPEYIDMSIEPARRYQYRIIPETSDDVQALPSKAIEVDT